MGGDKPTFVLIHGYWHDSGSWTPILPLLTRAGYEAHALDLPGAGSNAKNPQSYRRRPFDPAAFATEPSPNAGVTQEQRTQAVVDRVRAIGRPVVLVGHSMGGATISDVAETIPDSIVAAVYLTAFLLAPGTPPIAIMQHETMAAALVPSLFSADPEKAGALRLNPLSGDADYAARFRRAFYGDVGEAELAEFIPHLHPDEPLGTAVRPSAVTKLRFGKVARHYIRCTEDNAITAAGQDFMIAAVDAALGTATATYTMEGSSHSPFLSRPAELADLLTGIAARA